uniref:Ribosomal RNA-processing protein 14/surfeit locus protein 6 C-terminal domain-containing protein n=1 Tax=Meloidogyne incognita TaxID=6306 RepID=A0A914NQ34_MELIC
MENLLTSVEFAFTKTKLSVQDQKSSYPKRNLFKGRDYGRLLKKVESREEMLTQLRNKDASKAEDVATKIAWVFGKVFGLHNKDRIVFE